MNTKYLRAKRHHWEQAVLKDTCCGFIVLSGSGQRSHGHGLTTVPVTHARLDIVAISSQQAKRSGIMLSAVNVVQMQGAYVWHLAVLAAETGKLRLAQGCGTVGRP